jgi:hypothetical protein
MEHKFDPMRRDDSSSDPEMDFESYLRKKVDIWQQDVPVSQLSEIEIGSERSDRPIVTKPEPIVAPKIEEPEYEIDPIFGTKIYRKSAPVVVERQQSEVSLQAEGTSELSSSLSVSDVVNDPLLAGPEVHEKVEELSLRGVEGHQYVIRNAQDLKVDELWLKLANEAHQFAVTQMSAEDVIRRHHDLNELIRKLRAKQHGLNLALEDLLPRENGKRREELIGLRSKLTSKAKGGRKPAGPKKDKPIGITKVQKAIDTLFNLSMSKETIEKTIRSQGLFDESASAYLEKLFAR